ncbi:Ger(x)C family spore germination C-terminal domain-containing protein [Alkalihalobacterium elongatum]|uniref:Ger(x)C family spore germination C-terminal domain-containing protein n=1 Tax=Alkalihalobacterium elongatum TaxID=2675466 RepID=UPI001C1F5A96
MEVIIKTMQQLNADSIGIGRYVRNSISYKEWRQIDWREVYPNIHVTCNVEAEIRDFGYFR